jgi:hypothetical protein
MGTAVLAKKKERVITGEKVKPTSNEIRPDEQSMEKQLESPLNALINKREQLHLDELQDMQYESPLNATINQRDPLTISDATEQQMEYALNAQMNGRERTDVNETPLQRESPIHALINSHSFRRFWNSLRKEKNSQ